LLEKISFSHHNPAAGHDPVPALSHLLRPLIGYVGAIDQGIRLPEDPIDMYRVRSAARTLLDLRVVWHGSDALNPGA
jgi:hypothetical protein